MTTRLLRQEDAAAYRRLRLRMTQEHPEAYGSSYEDTLATPVEVFAERFAAHSKENFILGGSVDNQLQSVAGFYRSKSYKTYHRGEIWGVYTAPETRRQGLAHMVFKAMLEHCQQLEGLRDLKLAVTVGNHAARAFYESLGFICFATEPGYLRFAGRSYDIDWMLLDLSTDA